MHLSRRIVLAFSVSLAVAAIPSTASAQSPGVLHACVKTNSPQGPAGNVAAPEPMQSAAFQNAWQDVRPEHSPPGIEYEKVRFFKDASREVITVAPMTNGEFVSFAGMSFRTAD